MLDRYVGGLPPSREERPRQCCAVISHRIGAVLRRLVPWLGSVRGVDAVAAGGPSTPRPLRAFGRPARAVADLKSVEFSVG